MVEKKGEISNQIFRILEEWETVLQELDGNISLDIPKFEF
jgi:hypothetical protein